MIRTLPRLMAVFLAPFALFAVWLAVRRMSPLTLDPWTRRVLLSLTAAGLACVIVGLVAIGLTAPRHEGGYQPAHLENGRVVPGRMQ